MSSTSVKPRRPTLPSLLSRDRLASKNSRTSRLSEGSSSREWANRLVQTEKQTMRRRYTRSRRRTVR